MDRNPSSMKLDIEGLIFGKIELSNKAFDIAKKSTIWDSNLHFRLSLQMCNARHRTTCFKPESDLLSGCRVENDGAGYLAVWRLVGRPLSRRRSLRWRLDPVLVKPQQSLDMG